MMNNRVLRFLNSEILFTNCYEMQTEIDRIFNFFCSHFEMDENLIGKPIATIEVNPYEQFNRGSYPTAEFENVVIRRSSAKEFNLEGDKANVDDLEIIDSQGTGTAFVLNSKKKTVKAYLSLGSHVQFVELIRDLIIKHEEHCGTLILHAAAAVDHHGNGVVVVGNKGAGKSTFLLDLVGRQGYNFISGDKVFIRNKNGIALLYGWPEFPHLGYDTLKGHPALIEELSKAGYTIDDLYMKDKLLFTSDILQKAFGYAVKKNGVPLRNVIFPNVQATTEKTSLDLVHSIDRKMELLKHFEFSCDNYFAGYHNYMKMLLSKDCKTMVEKFKTIIETLNFYSASGAHPINVSTLSIMNKEKVGTGGENC